MALLMLVANLGTTLAKFAGIGAALSLFGVPIAVSAGTLGGGNGPAQRGPASGRQAERENGGVER